MKLSALRSFALLALISAAACSSSPVATVALPEGMTRVSAGALHAGDRVPVPSRSILDIKGAIGYTNSAGALSFDMATIDRLPTIDVTLYEPFLKRRVTYRGVLLSDILSLAKMTAGAKSLHMTALDDFVMDINVDQLGANDLVVATREEGKLMPVAKGGPTRIVFPDGASVGKDTEKWIWSLKTVEVR